MTTLFECVFNFTKDVESKAKEQKMVDDFNRLRSRVIDFTNPRLEKWNEAYEKQYGSYDDKNYAEFMSQKFQKYTDKINKSLLGLLSSIKIAFNPDTLDFIGIDKKDDECAVSMTLKPIE